MAVRGYQLSALPQAPRLDMNIRVADPSVLTRNMMRSFQIGSDVRENKEKKQLDTLANLYADQGASALEGLDEELAAKVKIEGEGIKRKQTLAALQEEMLGLQVDQMRNNVQQNRVKQIASILGEGGAVPMNIADEDIPLLGQAETIRQQQEMKDEEARLRLEALRRSDKVGAASLAKLEIENQANEILPMISFEDGAPVVPDDIAASADPLVLNRAIDSALQRKLTTAKNQEELARLSQAAELRQIQNAIGAINSGTAELEDFMDESYFPRLERAATNRFTTERTPEGILVTVDNITGERVHSVTAPTVRDGKPTRFMMPDWWKKGTKNMPVELYPSEREAMTEFMLALEGDEDVQDDALELAGAERRTGFFTGKGKSLSASDKADATLQFYQKLVDARNAEDAPAAVFDTPAQGVPTFATEADALSAARAGRIKKGQVVVIGGKRMELE